jgi:hypothetical protein
VTDKKHYRSSDFDAGSPANERILFHERLVLDSLFTTKDDWFQQIRMTHSGRSEAESSVLHPSLEGRIHEIRPQKDAEL